MGVQTQCTVHFFVSKSANFMPRFLILLLCNNVEGFEGNYRTRATCLTSHGAQFVTKYTFIA